jgi:hypothetical protein
MERPTPGPWRWDQHGDLRGKDGNAVINPDLRGDVLSAVNREADAGLIAAAPITDQKARDVCLAWAAGDNDAMQGALLGLFLHLFGVAPVMETIEETT